MTLANVANVHFISHVLQNNTNSLWYSMVCLDATKSLKQQWNNITETLNQHVDELITLTQKILTSG